MTNSIATNAPDHISPTQTLAKYDLATCVQPNKSPMGMAMLIMWTGFEIIQIQK